MKQYHVIKNWDLTTTKENYLKPCQLLKTTWNHGLLEFSETTWIHANYEPPSNCNGLG